MKRMLCALLALMLLLAMVPSTALAASTKKVYVSSTGSGTLNIRAGAGYDYKVVGYVHHNDSVKTYEIDGEWIKIKKGSKVGWIKTIYVDGTTKMLGTGYKGIKTASKVYAKASTSAKVVGSVSKSDSVKITYTEHNMAKVKVTGSGLTGWIPISSVGITVKLTADTPPSSSKKVYRTTASVLHMRSGAGTDYKVIDHLVYGTGCTILESKGNWRKVKTFGGKIGWVSATYLKKAATAKVTASVLNVRKGPGTNTTVIGGFKYGTKVSVLYTSGNWAYVTANKTTGYVSMTYLKFT